MDVSNCTMISLLPTWMREEADIEAFASIVDEVTQAAFRESRNLSVWNRIDQLPESALDELAWALDIEWWDSEASIETKRRLVRESDLVNAKKGTCDAVERVITAYFGAGRIMEWAEYAGDPHHFKIFTDNPQLVADNQIRFLNLLEKVKRRSSKLDGILIGLTGLMNLYGGIASRDHNRELHALGDGSMFMLSDMAIIETDHVKVRMTAGVER